LLSLVQNVLEEDPLSDTLFVFFNRRGNYLKALYWDRSGYCIWAKRLERGSFISNWRFAKSREMDCTELKLLLEGVEEKRRKMRYKH
jgi:transposase